MRPKIIKQRKNRSPKTEIEEIWSISPLAPVSEFIMQGQYKKMLDSFYKRMAKRGHKLRRG